MAERLGEDPDRAAPPLGRQPQAARPVRLGRRAAGLGRPAGDRLAGPGGSGAASGSPRPTGCTCSTPRTEVELTVEDGVVVARSTVQDMGTGSAACIAGIVREELGLPADRVRVEIGRSGAVHGPTSGGSRTTPSVAPAARDAADACAPAGHGAGQRPGAPAAPGRSG